MKTFHISVLGVCFTLCGLLGDLVQGQVTFQMAQEVMEGMEVCQESQKVMLEMVASMENNLYAPLVAIKILGEDFLTAGDSGPPGAGFGGQGPPPGAGFDGQGPPPGAGFDGQGPPPGAAFGGPPGGFPGSGSPHHHSSGDMPDMSAMESALNNMGPELASMLGDLSNNPNTFNGNGDDFLNGLMTSMKDLADKTNTNRRKRQAAISQEQYDQMKSTIDKCKRSIPDAKKVIQKIEEIQNACGDDNGCAMKMVENISNGCSSDKQMTAATLLLITFITTMLF